MRSSSIKAAAIILKELGVNASEYRDALIHDWYLNEKYAQHLEVYILRESPTETFFFHCKDGELFIKGKPYSITWVQSSTLIRSDYKYVLVSLRYCKHLGRGYALVKGLEGNAQFENLEYK